MLTEHRATSHAMNVFTSEVARDITCLCRAMTTCPHLVHYYQPLYFHLVDHITDIRVPDPSVHCYARTIFTQ